MFTKEYQYENIIAKVKIWDTAGQEKFHTITKSFYNQSQGVLLLFDLTDQHSFENVEKWMNDIYNHADQNVIKFLIGNKLDLVSQRVITKEVGLAKASKYKMQYFETSAKTGEGINETVEKLVLQILDAKVTKVSGGNLEEQRGGNTKCC